MLPRRIEASQRYEFDAPRWCDLSRVGAAEEDSIDAWFDLPHPMLELTQVAYQLLLGESTEPGVEIDEVEQLALEKNWEETLRSPPIVAPPSPAPSPSKAVSRRHLLSPSKSLGAPRRVLAPLVQQQAPAATAPAAQSAPAPACVAPAPARRTPAAIRFTAAPKP